MKRDDLDIFVRLHGRNPHATTAFDVAVAMLLYRRQLPADSDAPQVRPKDIQERLGITYDNARKALKRAVESLDSLAETSMQPDDNHPDDNHPTGRSSTGRSSTGKPDDNHPVPPHPPYKDQEEEKEIDIASIAKFPVSEESGNRLCVGLRNAIEALEGNAQTEPLGGYLSRMSHLPEVRALVECDEDGKYAPGWRLESAVRRFLSPGIPDSVRSCRNCQSSLNYLLAIARGLTEPYAPPALAPTGTAPGAYPPNRRPRRGPDFDSMNFGGDQ